jgi:hypothetical protein
MIRDNSILNLDSFIAKHGEPQDKIPFDLNKLENYNLPNELIYLWSEFGLSSFGNRFFWLVNPLDYLEDVKHWINEFENPLPFLRTSFGTFFFWDGVQIAHFNIVTGTMGYYSNSFNFVFEDVLAYEDTLNDIFFHDLYLGALPRLGVVERDECYGFFPPIAMGGEIRADKIQRVKLREHLAFLSQL